MTKTLTAAACLLLAAACTTPSVPPPVQADTPHQAATLRRVWMLTDLAGFSRDQLIRAQAKMDWTHLPRAGAHMGCNRMMFEAQPEPSGRIRFGRVAATRMYCADAMALENAFGSRLPAMTRYRVEGHRLILQDEQGSQMRFVAQDWD